MQTFWSSAGWRTEPTTPPGELAHAIEVGVMFDGPRSFVHDEVVARVVGEVSRLSLEEVSDAFLGSLTSRRLDMRSVLGSYAVARYLEPHGFKAGRHQGRCAVCGLRERGASDRNILNFERFKWGGVRRDDLEYVWLDLQLFSSADRPRPTRQDDAAMERILDELDAAPQATTTSRAAQTLLRGIAGNKDERSVLLDILGVCSVLETADHRGYATVFVAADDRTLPGRRFVDQRYPACWWTAEHGVNRVAARAFGLISA
jgi:hypothetical protein